MKSHLYHLAFRVATKSESLMMMKNGDDDEDDNDDKAIDDHDGDHVTALRDDIHKKEFV